MIYLHFIDQKVTFIDETSGKLKKYNKKQNISQKYNNTIADNLFS
ncbi:MAG: hypothetical protein QM535_11090 [Limnohabitans sp.]|nr:hypothetical protein [Limnohabitans sp.]